VGATIRTAAVIALAALLLLAPAIWNGYPFIFWDSGDYLMASLTGERVIYRDPVYGLLIAPLHWRTSLWGVAIGQSLLTAWILFEVVRQFGRTKSYLAIVALLAVGTSLPWFSAQIMPDIWGALAVLLIGLLALGELPAVKRIAYSLLLALAIACHLSFLPLALALLLLLLVLKWFLPVRLGAIVAAIALAPALIISANVALGGPAKLTETSHVFLLARLVQDGLAKQTLDRLCPDPALKLCAVKDRLPASANDFLWGDSEAFALVGGWSDCKEEAERIIDASLRLFPVKHVKIALQLSARQLVSFATGDGLESQAEPWGVIEPGFPGDFPAYAAARQQTGRVPVRAINLLHRPLAGLSMLLLPILAGLAWRRHRLREAAALLLVGGALLANAAVCGALSNPNDRYESRVVWLAVFAVVLAVRTPGRSTWPKA
jgi:hypothetical protein